MKPPPSRLAGVARDRGRDEGRISTTEQFHPAAVVHGGVALDQAARDRGVAELEQDAATDEGFVVAEDAIHDELGAEREAGIVSRKRRTGRLPGTRYWR